MTENRLIQGWINPLASLEVDEPWASMMKAKPTLEDVVRSLCPAAEQLGIERLVARYRIFISTEPVRLFIAPGDHRAVWDGC